MVSQGLCHFQGSGLRRLPSQDVRRELRKTSLPAMAVVGSVANVPRASKVSHKRKVSWVSELQVHDDYWKHWEWFLGGLKGKHEFKQSQNQNGVSAGSRQRSGSAWTNGPFPQLEHKVQWKLSQTGKLDTSNSSGLL